MASPLTADACYSLSFDEPHPEPSTMVPIMQVLSVKKINAVPGAAAGAADRYRLVLSDGKHFMQAMLGTQMNSLVINKEIDRLTVVKITGYVCNAVLTKRLLIVLGLEIVPFDNLARIGEPVQIEGPVAGGQAEPAAAAPQAAKPRASAPAKPRGNTSMGPLYPIESLSPYQNKWTIKARVTQRSEIKHWSNQKGEGKLFSVTLMDESGEIRATGFNTVVDNLYDKMAEGKVVFISRARVNIAKKQFSNVQNEYEIMFENHTEVEPCDDDTAVPQVKYAFKRIDELGDVQKDAVIDVIGVVKDVQELGSIVSKASQKPFSKRDIVLVDQTCQSVRLTLWGKQAETFDAKDHPVVAFKGVKVGDFGGRSLSMFSSATMIFNPDIAEAHGLRGWYDAQGHSATYNAYSSTGPTGGGVKPSEIKTLGQVKDSELGMGDKPDFFTSQATIVFIKNESFAYPACPTEGCNKKVVETGDAWRCEKCDQNYAAPVYRYILNMNVMDETSNLWVTSFNEIAEQILGISADDLTTLKNDDEAKALRIFNRACTKQYTLQMMGKPDTYNDTTRVRYSVRRASEVDFASEALRLAEEIKSFGV